MALRVKIAARAASQIHRAAEWWLANRQAVPGAVRIDIAEALALLSTHPGIGSLCPGARTQGVRRLLLGRIRYFIYYRQNADVLEVLALWHAGRGRPPSV